MECTGVEVVLGDLRNNPRCPHGPMLLFRREVSGTNRNFYACSACRDRKDCRFFLWADEIMTENKKMAWELEIKRVTPKINHAKLYNKFVKLLKKSTEERAFCHTCNILLLYNQIAKKHDNHDITIGISKYQMKHPSELLKPLECAKKEAQYLFSSHSTRTIVNIAQNLGAKRMLCLGTPRIHELLCSEKSLKMNSLLLDIDHRYHQFYSPSKFCWFNSFNSHFFSQEVGESVLSEFLKSDGGQGIILVMDPPFGGRVEPLAKTIQEITQLHKKLCPGIHENMIVLWIFPYFMEPQILASCPDFSMLDYKVDYDNHSLFATGPKARKHGSPVRIFTNANPGNIPFSKDEGYRYCKICDRWVSEENKHCIHCNKCTSKDGRTYIHCNDCMRCVKPSWKHCTTCKRCCLSNHVCGKFVPSQLCFNCGEPGHKKQDCHNMNNGLPIPVTKKSRMKRKHSQYRTSDITKFMKRQKVEDIDRKNSEVSLKKTKKKSKINIGMKHKLQI